MENVKGFCSFMFFMCAGLVLFTNFVTFILADGKDALALAYMTLASLYMHEYKHVKRDM
jgi:hypothetical protein